MNSYYIVRLTSNNNNQINENLLEEINFQAFEKCNCDGVEDFSLNEGDIDTILESDAYCGGNISDKLIDKIHDYQNQQTKCFQYFFNKESSYEDSNEFLDYLLVNLDPNLFHITIKKEFNKNWNEQWQKHFSTITISDNIKIIPKWEQDQLKDNSCTYPVIINPGMGFGTGNHPTTYLSIEAFNDLKLNRAFNPKTIIDYGCGSGILGITAKKMTDSLIDFYDIDQDALSNCRENINLNFNKLDSHSLRVLDSFESTKNKYDLIFANILLPVLIEVKSHLLNILKINGYLILSGVLKDQVKELINEYKTVNQFDIVQISSMDDWACILIQKK